MTAKKLLVPGIAGILFLLQFLRNTLTPVADLLLSYDGDVALHLKLGALMRESGGFLPTEPTNYLMQGAPFIAHEWLSQLLWSWSYDLFGLAGPVLLASGIVSALTAHMFARMTRDGIGTWPAIVVLMSAITVTNSHLHARPHVITWWFAFVALCWLEDHRRGTLALRPLLTRMLPFVWIWAQLHGGFLVTFILIGGYGLGALIDLAIQGRGSDAPGRVRDLTVIGVTTFLVSLLNPWGLDLHVHFLEWLASPYMTSFTSEFKSPDFSTTYGRFLLGFGILVLVAMAAPRRPPTATHFVLVAGFGFMALSSARHGALMSIVTAVWVAQRLHDALDDLAASGQGAASVAEAVQTSSTGLRDNEANLGGWGTIAAVIVAVTLAIGVWRTPEASFDPRLQPIDAVQWIEAHPEETQGRMFNPFRWGAYIAWRLYPTHQTFINSWHDHLGERAMKLYFAVHDVHPKWREILAKHDVQWVIYETNSELGMHLNLDPAWDQVYTDPTATIWRLSNADAGQP